MPAPALAAEMFAAVFADISVLVLFNFPAAVFACRINVFHN
jgi:hypothetical protein